MDKRIVPEKPRCPTCSTDVVEFQCQASGLFWWRCEHGHVFSTININQ